MTRTAFLTSAIVLVVLAAGGSETGWADRPELVAPGDFQTPPVDLSPLLRPRVAEYWHSDCYWGGDDPDWLPCEGDDEVELRVEGSTLHTLHTNATYNCCLDDIVVSLEVQGDWLLLTEEEILTDPCYCICCYEVAATVVDLAPGTYTVEYCWFDYQTNEERCHVEEIVIGGGGCPDPGPPPPQEPGDSQADPLKIQRALRTRIGEQWHSDCYWSQDDPDWWPCEGDDEVELWVEGNTLHTLHTNATYNCCLDDIVVSLEVQGDWLLLTEEEILTDPCWCICCYDVTATVVDLAPGTYTVEYCWFDYEMNEERCHVEEIVIP